MKLILTRHAKSAWDDPLLDDHDRFLTKRGHRSARLIGDWLAGQDCVPDHVLCSTATRARETLEGMMAQWDAAPQVTLAPQLYLSSPETMLHHIKRQPACILMVVAHNPGMAELASSLAQDPAPHPDFRRYPTAATTIFQFDIDSWQQIATGRGKLVQFTVPRALDS